MPNKHWTEAQTQVLMNEYPKCANPRDLAKSLNKSYTALKTYALRLKLKREVRCVGRVSDDRFDQYIIENYLRLPVKTLAKNIGKSYTFVTHRLSALQLTIPQEIIAERKKLGQIKPGNTPNNKGKKWDDFMSKEGQLKSKSTTFKKGNLPHNTKYDGSIRVRTDKSGIKYKYIRISKGKWELLQRKIWSEQVGPIPPDHLIAFKNGDTMDVRIENLEMISLEENMKRNSIHSYGPEIAKIYQLKGAISRQINKHSKKLKA